MNDGVLDLLLLAPRANEPAARERIPNGASARRLNHAISGLPEEINEPRLPDGIGGTAR